MENIIVTPHAMLKASEEFGVNYGPDSRNFIIDNLNKSTFVSEIVGEGGKVDRLFGYRRIAFILDRYENVVITVYPRENVDAGLRKKVTELLFDHLAELEEQERKLEEELLTLDMELEMLKAFYRVGIFEGAFWYRALDRERTNKSKELRKFRLEKSKVAKGIVAYL